MGHLGADSCTGCNTSVLIFPESKESCLCKRCRDKLIPSHIPVEQHVRYLKRIGHYERSSLYNM